MLNPVANHARHRENSDAQIQPNESPQIQAKSKRDDKVVDLDLDKGVDLDMKVCKVEEVPPNQVDSVAIGVEVTPQRDEEKDAQREASIMMMVDALHRNCGLYYIEEVAEDAGKIYPEQVVRTVWDTSPHGVFWARALRREVGTKINSRASTLLMLLIFFEHWEGEEYRSTMQIVIDSVEGAILLYFWFIFLVYMSCIWGQRRSWLKARESKWIFGLGIALVVSTMGAAVSQAGVYDTVRTFDGDVFISSWECAGWMFRAYFFLLFNAELRHAGQVLLNVLKALGPIASMVLCSFIIHYFIFNTVVDDGSETQLLYNFGEDGDTVEALYELYICLTTANYPDIFLPLYNEKRWTFLLTMSFMVFTVIILLNLLLAVVASEYSDVNERLYSKNYNLRTVMLSTAFNTLADLKEPDAELLEVRDTEQYIREHIQDPRDKQHYVYPSVAEFLAKLKEEDERLQNVQREKDAMSPGPKVAMSNAVMKELLESCSRQGSRILKARSRHKVLGEQEKEKVAAIGGEQFKLDSDWKDLVIHMMTPTDSVGFIGIDEFQRLALAFQCPIKMKNVDLLEVRYEREKLKLQKGIREQKYRRNKATPDMESSFELTGLRFLIDIIESAPQHIASNKHCKSHLREIKKRAKGLQAELQAAVSDLAESRIERKKELTRLREELEDVDDMGIGLWDARFKRLYKLVEEDHCGSFCYFSINFLNLTNALLIAQITIAVFKVKPEHPIFIILTVLLSVEIVMRFFAEMTLGCWYKYCLSLLNVIDVGGCGCMWAAIFIEQDWLIPAIGLTRAVRVLRLVNGVPSLRLLGTVITRMLPATLPHRWLFYVVFYVYGVWGMAMWGGEQTKVVQDDGPGQWATAPWNGTSYGQTPYYYRLNFDRFYDSFCTLFILLVQNNWPLITQGFVETQGYENRHAVRLWFVSFNALVAILMINVLIGVLIGTLDLYRRDEESKYQAQVEEQAQKKNLKLIRFPTPSSRKHLTREKIRWFKPKNDEPDEAPDSPRQDVLDAVLADHLDLGFEFDENLLFEEEEEKQVILSADATVLRELTSWMQNKLNRRNTPSSLPWDSTWYIKLKSSGVEQMIVDFKMVQGEDEDKEEQRKRQENEEKDRKYCDLLEKYRSLEEEVEQYRLMQPGGLMQPEQHQNDSAPESKPDETPETKSDPVSEPKKKKGKKGKKPKEDESDDTSPAVAKKAKPRGLGAKPRTRVSAANEDEGHPPRQPQFPYIRGIC